MSAILRNGAAVLIAPAILAWIFVAGHDWLPVLTIGDRSTPSLTLVVAMIAILTAATLLVLAMRRPQSVLDVWLIVALIAWLLDIALDDGLLLLAKPYRKPELARMIRIALGR